MYNKNNRLLAAFFILVIIFLATSNFINGDELTNAFELLKPLPSTDDKTNRISIKLISFYQGKISPLNKPSCMFFPSCSWFAIEAIQRYGFLPALLMTSERALYREVPNGRELFLMSDNGLLYNPVYFNYIFNPGDYLNYKKYFFKPE